jgi:branched-chain amino acid transport system permease protein
MRTRTFVDRYERHLALSDNPVTWAWLAVLAVALILLPFVLGNYAVTVMIAIGIACVGAIGLNLLTGVTGLISIGQSGFLATGAYTTALLIADYGWREEPAFIMGGVAAALLSVIIGIPSLRLKGLYLAITTLAFSFIVLHIILYAENITHGPNGVRIARPQFLGLDLTRERQLYYFILVVVVLTTLFALNLLRSRIGRAWIAIRDQDIAARVMGINLIRYKLLAFAVSSFIVGIAGSLIALQLRFIGVDVFSMLVGVEALAMIIVGGLGSIAGSILGAIFITLLPEAARIALGLLPGQITGFLSIYIFEIRGLLVGLAIIVMLRIEPDGLIAVWRNTRKYWTQWPLSVRAR